MSDDLLALLSEARSQRDTAQTRADECEAWVAAQPNDGWLRDELDRRREDAAYFTAEVEHLERCAGAVVDVEWSGDRLLDGAEHDLFGRRAS